MKQQYFLQIRSTCYVFFFNIIKTKIKIDKVVLKTFEICMPCIFTYQRIHISAPQFSLNINAATLRNFDVPK
jgi:hypothetical protein